MNSPRELMNLYGRRVKHPRGILEFSLQMKEHLIQTETEEKKKEIRSLMSRGAKENIQNYCLASRFEDGP